MNQDRFYWNLPINETTASSAFLCEVQGALTDLPESFRKMIDVLTALFDHLSAEQQAAILLQLGWKKVD